jgi:uncharacterized membrane protein
MSNKQVSITLITIKTFLCGAVGGAVAALVAAPAATLLPREVQATPAYAAQTGATLCAMSCESRGVEDQTGRLAKPSRPTATSCRRESNHACPVGKRGLLANEVESRGSPSLGI